MQDGNIVHFKIKKKTQLKKLMEMYCARQSLQMEQIRFLFKGNRLRDSQTPDELEMEDDDVIDAMLFQVGVSRSLALVLVLRADRAGRRLRVRAAIVARAGHRRRGRRRGCAVLRMHPRIERARLHVHTWEQSVKHLPHDRLLGRLTKPFAKEHVTTFGELLVCGRLPLRPPVKGAD